MNKQLLCLLIALCIFTVRADQSSEQALEAESNLERATELLEDLLADARSNLRELEASWQQNRALLEQDLENQRATLQVTSAHCDSEANQLRDYQDQLQNTRDYIEYLKKRISDNLNRLDALNETRCQQNQNFVRDMKNFNLALRLIDFLRQQVTNKESFSLAEKKQLMLKITTLFQLYEQHDTKGLELLQQYVDDPNYTINNDESVQGRSVEEIGSGHLDNDRGNLSLRDFVGGDRHSWGAYKRQLLDVLDSFQQKIVDHKNQAQQDEVNSVLLLAEFQAKIEKENKELAHELEEALKDEARLERLVSQYTENVRECEQQKARQQQSIADAEENLRQRTEEYGRKHAGISEEIELLEEVLNMYNSRVSKEQDFKDRVDEVASGNYSDDYNKREVPEWKLLGNEN